MQQATVGPKYQVVIPKQIRQKIKGFNPGAKVTIKEVDAETISVKTSKKSWSDETYGFMKEAWRKANPTSEIETMRNEWDEKLK